MSSEWRPLVGQGILPWWVRLRDVVLTSVAWVILFWLMRHALLALWVGAHALAGVTVDVPGFSLSPKWELLLPFLQTTAGIMLLLAVLTWQRRGLLRAQPQSGAEPWLDPALHCARFDMELPELAALREGGVRVVRFEADGRITGVESLPEWSPQAQASAPTGI